LRTLNFEFEEDKSEDIQATWRCIWLDIYLIQGRLGRRCSSYGLWNSLF